jgi:hypothetical protein
MSSPVKDNDKEAEIKHLKNIFKNVLQTLGKISNEKDFKKAFREQEGQNINNALDKVKFDIKVKYFVKILIPRFQIEIGTTVYNFLRFSCSDICDVYRNDGEIKIHRLSNDPECKNCLVVINTILSISLNRSFKVSQKEETCC